MEDTDIVELFWQRDEQAIVQTEVKYSRYLRKIANNILADSEDAEESVNDVYLCAWESIPPRRPHELRGYLGSLTRQIAIDRYRRKHAKKRGGSEYAISLEELYECLCGGHDPEQNAEAIDLAGAISDYLLTRTPQARKIFVCRYYFADSIADIAGYLGTTQSSVKSSLNRTRNGLKLYLKQEGYI